MALLKEFSELLGGSVSVDSEPGKGSTFTVNLPAKKAAGQQVDVPQIKYSPPLRLVETKPSKHAEDVTPPPLPTEKNLPKVLIVEDNVELAAFVASTLNDLSQTRTAKNGQEALHLLQDWKANLIISDIMMPKLDGFELCRRIKSSPETSLTPVLLLTSMTDHDTIVTGFNAGADDYVPKPFHPRELHARVKSILTAIKSRKEAESVLVNYNEKLEKTVNERTAELEMVNAQLNRQKQQLNLIINSLPAGVAYVDKNENLVYCNDTYANWYAKEPETLVGCSVRDISGARNYQRIQPTIQKVLSGLGTTLQGPFEFADKERYLDAQYAPHLTEQHEIEGFVALLFDVTTYKSIEQQLAVAKCEAEAANRAKSAFLANMSHEIRTPLGAVVGYSELVANSDISVSDRQNYVAVIKRNSDLLSNIINDILDLSKVEVGRLDIEKRDVDISEILADITSLLGLKAAEKGITLSVTSTGVIHDKIHTDPLRLRQILLNVVGNAIKFTDHGSVQIKIKQVTHGDRDLLSFVVIDTGRGLSKDEARELFKPFSQADSKLTRKHGGAGLGLALSKRLAELLGGDVVLTKTAPDEGSTFTITIDPGNIQKVLFQNISSKGQHIHDPQKPEARKLTLVSPEDEPLQGIDILLVEDSPDNQALFEVHLKKAGAIVHVADNGREAVQKARESRYDIVLMDLQMPIMDGYEATAQLRNQNFTRPIIALTAHALKSEVDKCLRSGFDAHVSKPINRQQLIETIQRLVRQK